MFPNYYYGLQFKIPSSHFTVEILMVDTVLLCGNSDSDFLYKQPEGPDNLLHAEDQWTWLETRLQASKYVYLCINIIMINHHLYTKPKSFNFLF